MSRERAGALVVGGVVSMVTLVVTGGPVDAEVSACAPTITTTSGRTTAVFTTVGTCSFTLPDGATDVSVLIVGGGGAGGWSDVPSASGGGGGGVLVGESLSISGAMTVTVGSGGAGNNDKPAGPPAIGGDSSIVGADFSLIADGGARGSGYGDGPPQNGGSGSGAHEGYAPAGEATQGAFSGVTGVLMYGSDGGPAEGSTGGGGGGATEIGGTGSGSAGGDGGDGLTYQLGGISIVVGSGGGGCGPTTNGVGGAGAGSGPGSAGGAGSSGTPNRGGGGGCSSGDAANPADPPIISGSGGSGLVVISHAADSFCRSFRSLGRDPLDVRRQPIDPVELGPGRLACRARTAG